MRSSKARFSLFVVALAASTFSLRAQDQTAPAAPPSSPPASSGDQSDQTPPPPRRGRGGMLTADQIKDKIPGITDDQIAKIKSIMQDVREQGQKIRQDDSLSDEDKRQKAMALRQQMVKDIRALLTADQQTAFDKLVAHGGRRPRNPDADASAPPPPPAPPADGSAPPPPPAGGSGAPQ